MIYDYSGGGPARMSTSILHRKARGALHPLTAPSHSTTPPPPCPAEGSVQTCIVVAEPKCLRNVNVVVFVQVHLDWFVVCFLVFGGFDLSVNTVKTIHCRKLRKSRVSQLHVAQKKRNASLTCWIHAPYEGGLRVI